MIVDTPRFVRQEEPYWAELEHMLLRLEADLAAALTYEEACRLHYLYHRASAGLARLAHMRQEPQVHAYLEPLVARAYAEIHQRREQPYRFNPFRWFTATFPQTFRRRRRAFTLSCTVFLLGCLFGAFVLAVAPQEKSLLLPFEHLMGSPSERVAMEESTDNNRIAEHGGEFSAMLMTNNTRVSILAMALGISFAFGTFLLLFYNGIILGAVAFDYVMAGETPFLLGWLLPHGAVEIPAILIAGQAGIVLGCVLLGAGSTEGVRTRLRRAAPDLVTLIFGVAIMLVWAGIVEAFLSQYHEPVLPYWLKIAFGVAELIALFAFLNLAGLRSSATAEAPAE